MVGYVLAPRAASADQILRTRFLNHNFSANVPSPIVQRPKPSLFEFSTVWPLLIKAFEINTRLKPETLEAAGPLGQLAKKMGSETVLGAGLVETDLKALDIPLDPVKRIISFGTG